jgi:hypothetical protein
MLAHTGLPLTAIAVWLTMSGGQSLAQTKTDLVCWAERPGQCPGVWSGPNVRHIACGSGGNAGFNPTWVCQQTCGIGVGPRCRITAGPGGDGGQCGYRAAKVECFE